MGSVFLSGVGQAVFKIAQSTFGRAFLQPQASLRSDDPTKRVSPRQHDAAMIHFLRGSMRRIKFRHALTLNQRPAASRAPVSFRLRSQHSVAMAAYAFHE
jgi:hypothetical protein